MGFWNPWGFLNISDSASCSFIILNTHFFIQELSLSCDLQPQNFISLNNENLKIKFALKHEESIDYQPHYEWLRSWKTTDAEEGQVFHLRKFEKSENTVVIINSSTSKFRIEFRNDDKMDEYEAHKPKNFTKLLMIPNLLASDFDLKKSCFWGPT